MNIALEAILDRLEPHFTERAKRWQNKPPPRWLRSPDWDLKPAELYSLRLYLRVALVPALVVDCFILLGWLIPLAFLCRRYPWFWHRVVLQRGPAHAMLIGLLAHEGYYWTPLGLVLLLGFSVILHLPRLVFWNRRALRLRAVANGVAAPAEAESADLSVWPPAPNRPAV